MLTFGGNSSLVEILNVPARVRSEGIERLGNTADHAEWRCVGRIRAHGYSAVSVKDEGEPLAVCRDRSPRLGGHCTTLTDLGTAMRPSYPIAWTLCGSIL
jgi:hypothetical protein